MASNFDFLSQEPRWEQIALRARKAEQGLAVAPEVAAIFGRSAMELSRRRYIDYDLEAAGWIIGDNCRIEEEVSGTPNASQTGFADYVLYGRDGKPLAIVEAKRTSFDPEKGAKQAKLYADSYEHRYGRRPFIFMTNGLRTLFLDEASGYPRREVSGFFTQDDLQMRMDRRGTQQPLSEIEPNHKIAGRPYQIEAVKAVEEAFDQKRRKAPLRDLTMWHSCLRERQGKCLSSSQRSQK